MPLREPTLPTLRATHCVAKRQPRPDPPNHAAGPMSCTRMYVGWVDDANVSTVPAAVPRDILYVFDPDDGVWTDEISIWFKAFTEVEMIARFNTVPMLFRIWKSTLPVDVIC